MFERERVVNKNEGWVYCGENKKNQDLQGFIKIGLSTNNVSSRENNTNGAGYNIFFAVKVDNCKFYEQLLHKVFEENNYQNIYSSKKIKDTWEEWFEINFENLLPLLLEIAIDFEIRDEDYCTKICKQIDKNQDFYKVLFNRNKQKFLSLQKEIKRNYGYCPLLEQLEFDSKEIVVDKKEVKDNMLTIKQEEKDHNEQDHKYWKIGENEHKEYDYRSFFNDYNLFNKKFYFFHTKIHKEYVAVLQRDMNFLYNNKVYSPSGLARIFYKEKYGKDMSLRGFDWLAPEGFTKPVLYLLTNFEDIDKYMEK